MLRNLAALTVLAPTLWMISAQALGLGDIELRSRLNQRFLATIPVLSAGPEDLESLSVTLASDEVFARSGIDRSSFVSTLKFVLGVGGIKVISDQVVRDPFVNFIVQARWNGGRFLREYTVLLDPPGEPVAEPAVAALVPEELASADTDGGSDALLDAPSGIQSFAEAGVDTGANSGAEVNNGLDRLPVEIAAATPAPTRVVRTAAPASSVATNGDVYGPVLETQTLWSVARELRPSSEVTMEQMVLAIYRANPQAFGGGSINRLLSGSLLNVPTAEQVTAVDAETAHNRVDALRAQPLGRSALAAAPVRTAAPAAAVPEPPAPVVPVLAPAPTPVPAPSPTEAQALPAPATAAEADATEAPSPSAESPVEPASETPAASAPEPAPASAPAPIAEPPPTPVPADATFSIEDYGLSWPLIGGLLVLIFLLMLVVWKRRSKPKPKAKMPPPDTLWVSMPVIAAAVPEARRSTLGAVADAEAAAPVPSEPAEPEAPAEPTPEAQPEPESRLAESELPPLPEDGEALLAEDERAASVLKLDGGDPLTEADFHLAYGLHDEAIQMLSQAIAEEPERADLQRKLAEVYAAAAAAKAPPAELSIIDFDLDSDLEKPEVKPDTKSETRVEIDSGLSPDEVAAAPFVAPPALEPVPDATPVQAAPGTVDPLADIDLSRFDLAAEPPTEPPLDPRLIEFGFDELEASAEPEPEHPLSASVDEIDTKLDLARAYADMGDIEAAGNLLTEVIATGSDDQKIEAEALQLRLKDAG
ncbi:FimV/HubP family polar landmark protein [Nevskia ramosa]|uniref:FimV/HubP family polar landmark protein n=1 Tax=Nevskia ramosa TaxID=64002 RepID=UPI003D0E7CE0